MPSVLSRPVASPPRPSARRGVALASAAAARRLERLTRLAARALGAAAAQLVVLDRDRLVVRGRAGLAAAFGARGELPPGDAVCRHVIEARAALAVDDASRHPFADEDGAGEREGLAAFAAVPLVARDGEVVGALLAADATPRAWTGGQIAALEEIAAAMVEELDATLADEQRAATDRARIEEHLRGSLRMEAIGRLAGGIAHDFNNLLTAVRYSSDALRASLDPSDARRAPVEEIEQAADRAAALTRQLLAFGRRQSLQPEVLDLNAVVGDVERMLRRLIGADVELVAAPASGLGRVRADRAQLEQVLVNLAVNARDAMPSGGVLMIETANVTLGRDYAERHPAVAPGSYVMLAVTDTGSGMDADTRAHIFEPFFSTKADGTGLGLSTVYGVVKQSGGYVWCYSEPGHGTTFKIYLPRVDAAAEVRRPAPDHVPTRAGAETVLLVEDEDLLRGLMRRSLELRGYTVLEARHGADALRVSETFARPIHLVVTDVIMPTMGGRALAARLLETRPGTRVLFMSGYTGGDVARRGMVGVGAAFVEKPLTPDGLASKIREVLDGGERGMGNGER